MFAYVLLIKKLIMMIHAHNSCVEENCCSYYVLKYWRMNNWFDNGFDSRPHRGNRGHPFFKYRILACDGSLLSIHRCRSCLRFQSVSRSPDYGTLRQVKIRLRWRICINGVLGAVRDHSSITLATLKTSETTPEEHLPASLLVLFQSNGVWLKDSLRAESL